LCPLEDWNSCYVEETKEAKRDFLFHFHSNYSNSGTESRFELPVWRNYYLELRLPILMDDLKTSF
uniref:Myotubularin phosphatase domain-containing protein n=1 Tax=Rodentolepis nana TaxID=102285 RepID=A0A0R3TSV6_RODNA